MLRRVGFFLLRRAVFVRDFLCRQEVPDGFVGVEGVAGFADLFLAHVLLAAGPGIAAILDGIEHYLSVIVASIESKGLALLFTFLQWLDLLLCRLFIAAVELGPSLGAVFGGEHMELTRLVSAASIRNDGVIGAVQKQRRHRSRRQTDHRLRQGRAYRGDCGHAIGHFAAHAQRHESAVAQASRVNAVSVHGVFEGELVEHLVKKSNVVGRLRPVPVLIRILSSALSASTTSAGVTTATTRIATTAAGIASTAHPSMASVAASGRHCRLLLVHSNIPPAARGVGVDRYDALLIGDELVKVREPLHVVGFLVLTGQENHDWIVLL